VPQLRLLQRLAWTDIHAVDPAFDLLGGGWRLPTDDEWRQMASAMAVSATIRLTKGEPRSWPS
jgi:hypothetical protein